MLEAGADKGEETPEDEDERRGLVLNFQGEPYRQTHQGIAQDPAEQELDKGSAHLRGTHLEDELPGCAGRGEARENHHHRKDHASGQVCDPGGNPDVERVHPGDAPLECADRGYGASLRHI